MATDDVRIGCARSQAAYGDLKAQGVEPKLLPCFREGMQCAMVSWMDHSSRVKQNEGQ